MPHQEHREHEQWNWARRSLSGCDWVRVGAGVGVEVGVGGWSVGVDQLRCDPIRSDPKRCCVSVFNKLPDDDNGTADRGQRRADSGQRDIGRSYDHAYTMWIIFQRLRRTAAHLMRKHNEILRTRDQGRHQSSQPDRSPLPNHLTSFQDVVVAVVAAVVAEAAAASNGTRWGSSAYPSEHSSDLYTL